MSTVGQDLPERPPGAAAARTVELDHGQALAVDGASVKVIFGGVWLVGTDRASDYLLASEEAAVRVPRGSLIRAIGRTRIEVMPLPRSALLHRWRQALRRWVRPRACPCAARGTCP